MTEVVTQLPNVVLIFMDDMTHWALTSNSVQTPNLDRLRVRGTTFTHAFNQGSRDVAVCMPARQMLLSGLTLFHAESGFIKAQRIGATLGTAGYDTFFTGKWHNEPAALEADYDHVGPWAGVMLESTEVGGEAYFRPSPGNDWDPSDTTRAGHWMQLPDGRIQHSSERWTDAAVGFLKKQNGSKPFFLHLAYHAPHDPRQSPAEYIDRYPIESIPLPPNIMAEHPFDNGELHARDESLAPKPLTEDAVRLHRQEYAAILTHADNQIGRVLGELEKQSILEDTVIVFSGDHGLALGEHGLLGKQNPYDHSIRVPLVFAGPGVPAGAIVEELVYSGSIYPTICDLVDVPAPEHIEFSSLRPQIVDHASSDGEVFGAYKDFIRYVRTTSYKYIQNRPTGIEQLFDVESDPWELTNLAAEDSAVATKEALARRLARLQAEIDDPVARLE